ncbi:MAG: hypothetical protein HN805_04065 [Rhodobacteraceae bacterium]|nr:hypothetical protein [Paracoccaceae bacterium]
MSDKNPKDAAKRPIEDAELVEQSEPQSAPSEAAEGSSAPATPNHSTFRVMFLFLAGGILAGGLGFGAAVLPAYLNPSDPLTPIVTVQDALAEQLAQHGERIKQIEAKPAPKDHTDTIFAMTEAIEALRSDIDQRQASIEAQLQALAGRLVEVEKQPLAQSLSPQAIKAYESELAQLRSDLAQVVQSASAQIEQTKAKAEELQMTTDARTRTGTITAALNAIRAAAENGAGYEAALFDLISATEVDLPEALQAHAKDGVAQLGGLQDRFSPAARAALKAIRLAEGPQTGENRLLAFLKAQFGVRSLEPQPGNSAEAVLSRAQAAVTKGDLTAALSELSALPQLGQDHLQDWIAAAQSRVAVQAALSELSSALSGN